MYIERSLLAERISNAFTIENLGLIYGSLQCVVLAILILAYFILFQLFKSARKEKNGIKATKIFDLNGKYLPLTFILLHAVLFLLSVCYSFEIILGMNVTHGKTYIYQHYCDISLILFNFGIHAIFWDIRKNVNSQQSRLIFLFVILVTSFIFELNIITLNYCHVSEYGFFDLMSIENKLFFALYITKLTAILYIIICLFIKDPFTYYYTYNAADNKGFNKFKNFLVKFQMLGPFLWPESWRLRFYLFLCLILVISGRVVTYYLARKTSELVSLLNESGLTIGANALIKKFSVYGILLLLQGNSAFSNGVLHNLRTMAWQPIKIHAINIISIRVYSHAHGLPLTWFLKKKADDLASLINRGGSNVDNILSHTIFNIIIPLVDVITAILSFINLMNPAFVIIMGITFAIYLLFVYLIIKPKQKYQGFAYEANFKARSIGMDAMINYETVKYCGNENYEINRYSEDLSKLGNAAFRESKFVSSINIVQNFIVIIGFITGCCYCIHDILKKGKGKEDFILFLTYVQHLYPSLAWLGTYIETINSSMQQIDGILALLREKTVDLDDSKDSKIPIVFNNLKLEGIKFKYDKKEIIKGVSFTLAKQKVLGIVGASGSGKTTLIQILSGILNPDEGNILLNNINVERDSKRSLRKIVGVVPQEVVLLNDTILENVKYGNLKSTEMELSFTKVLFNLEEQFSNSQDGLNSKVQERGKILSGGEKQRIAWARAWLKQPRILLIDEIKSSLGDQSAANWLELFFKIRNYENAAVIVVNRLSTVKLADEILFLNDGKTVQGKHEDLINDVSNGYKKFWDTRETQPGRN